MTLEEVDRVRRRLADEVASLRAALPADPAGDAALSSAIDARLLERLVTLGGGVLGCLVIDVVPWADDSSDPVEEHTLRNEKMIAIALKLVGPIVRRGDLMTRTGGRELACLLPGTGPLEARGIGRRLCQAIDGQAFWFGNEPHTMRCRMGLASRSSLGLSYDFASLLEAARRKVSW